MARHLFSSLVFFWMCAKIWDLWRLSLFLLLTFSVNWYLRFKWHLCFERERERENEQNINKLLGLEVKEKKINKIVSLANQLYESGVFSVKYFASETTCRKHANLVQFVKISRFFSAEHFLILVSFLKIQTNYLTILTWPRHFESFPSERFSVNCGRSWKNPPISSLFPHIFWNWISEYE